MKLCFQTQRVYKANIIERGDRYDQSVVHLLSTLPGEAFLVEKKGGGWRVTTGQLMVDIPVPTEIPVKAKTLVPVVVKDEPAVIKINPYKLKAKLKTKKGKR